jgi:GTP-binding protein HflX
MRRGSTTIYVSAIESTGLKALLERIDKRIEEDRVSRVHLRLPQKEGKMLALLESRAQIHSRAYKDSTVELEVDAPESVVRRVKEFVI